MDGNDSEGRGSRVQGSEVFGRQVPREVAAALSRLPPLSGRRIRLSWRAGMRAYRGRLLSGPGPGPGMEVHAASFIRERRMVLDRALLPHPPELARILIHELFHFAWVRLSNANRLSWERALAREFELRARGELGWSSELRKAELPADALHSRTRAWREYACESFCDTAAFLFGGLAKHPEFNLKPSFRRRRAAWFSDFFRHRQGGLRI